MVPFNIPVISEKDLSEIDYDTVLVTAWNYKEDILKRSDTLFKKGTKLTLKKNTLHQRLLLKRDTRIDLKNISKMEED